MRALVAAVGTRGDVRRARFLLLKGLVQSDVLAVKPDIYVESATRFRIA